MTVHGIAYLDLYTQDRASTIDYFAGLGFARVAESQDDDRRSTLLRQGDLRLVVTSGPAVRDFLDKHGDGVADIALTCDDAPAAVKRAVAAGAADLGSPCGAPVVSGFGDVRHTLLPAAEGDPGRTPPTGRWVPVAASVPQPPETIRLLDHIAVCVEGGRLGEYAGFYRDAFAFTRYSAEYVALGGQAMDSVVVRSASENVTFTLVAPDPGKESGQLEAFLDRNGGPGVQHLAFLVDDIVSAVRRFRDGGVDFLSTPDSYYDMLSTRLPGLADRIEGLRDAQVLADSDEWGHLMQLFTKSPYERNTLFFELIQRQGSRGFGSANIRALYEAVERDRLAAS
ncbi:4-hydroxyphenylpyruvate dioxygenase [Streptomyces ipomoeae]|uniref:4-hydroxyphenylpyruvate dioxygenase n=2 Tax=Streptomyces ipomoeae TaxID=103232 RepID=L1KKM7_9ACTN|nr:4-hydroxyphenylpyruvate dioxygenase [Streptomyces ipomoeae]EKX61152.1 4-hydroxyphenylpyruvate dioxygenase [Streptomyces ipomoeae 91-03]MDX2694713.1 4-hydroxyphenylpyruvate dioxygenase [Streptomyces ipomoeae]MDX2821945.1 4-hydroxyphenylpyruvate dioxygenase [Streptomyces ipomoeae]MDX2839888.1 4-hydroxyphenylpyruvate dioxygenase [Streptomyces ipomoeae]MDX2874634.1 4-hydroxyphenylpyruvate dioxygenase [Streptomyces ipomoeae]